MLLLYLVHLFPSRTLHRIMSSSRLRYELPQGVSQPEVIRWTRKADQSDTELTESAAIPAEYTIASHANRLQSVENADKMVNGRIEL